MDHIDYSIQERVACCFWFDTSRSTDDVQEKFRIRFGSHKMAPSRPDIRHWYQRFIKTGCLIHDDNGNLDLDIHLSTNGTNLFKPSNCCQSIAITSTNDQSSLATVNENLQNGYNPIQSSNDSVDSKSNQSQVITTKGVKCRRICKNTNNIHNKNKKSNLKSSESQRRSRKVQNKKK